MPTLTSEVTETASSEKESASGYASLWHNRQFMSLWIAQIFSQLADRAVFVLFVALLTSHNITTVMGHQVGAAQMTSLLYVAFSIPAVFFSPVAGVFVDRWSNRAVLVFSNVARAIFVALVTLPVVGKSPMAAFSLAFLISIGSQFFGPAETSSIPRLVKPQDLYSANSLFFSTMMMALGFGFAIGEPIIEQTGIGGAPYAVAAGFLIAAVLVLGISDNKRSPDRRNEAWWEEMRFGMAYIANNKTVFQAILKITVLSSMIVTLNIIAVGLAEQVMKIQPYQFGYIIAAAGLGMGIGNFWVGHYGQKLNPTLMAYGGFAGLGLFMSLLASLGFLQDFVFPNIGWGEIYFRGWLMSIPLLLASLIGVSCAFVAVPTAAALQAAVPEELRGKVFSAQSTSMSASSIVPVVATGVLADNLPGGVSTTLLLIGLPTFIAGLYFFFHHKEPKAS